MTVTTIPDTAVSTLQRWIVVADDNALLRDIWLEALGQAGYWAVGCEDGLEALKSMHDVVPDLLLLDLRMPKLSGEHVVELLRATRRQQAVPILIVSAHLHDGPPPRDDAQLNIVGRLEKPVSLDTLLATVADALGTDPGGQPTRPSRQPAANPGRCSEPASWPL